MTQLPLLLSSKPHIFFVYNYLRSFIPISVLSFNRDENIFVDVKHLKHVQLPSNNREANIPSRSVDCSSFVFYCLPFQPTSSSSTFRWQTVRPLVNVTFWPNNSRDSRISLKRMDCISFSNFRSRHPFDGSWNLRFIQTNLKGITMTAFLFSSSFLFWFLLHFGWVINYDKRNTCVTPESPLILNGFESSILSTNDSWLCGLLIDFS